MICYIIFAMNFKFSKVYEILKRNDMNQYHSVFVKVLVFLLIWCLVLICA